MRVILFSIAIPWVWAQPRIIPHITSQVGGFTTEIMVSNLSETEVTAQISAYSTSGSLLVEAQFQLVAGTTQQHDAHQRFGSEVAYLVIDPSPGVYVTAIYTSTSNSSSPAHVPESRLAGRRWRFFNGNWDHVFDGIAFVNIGEQTTDVKLTQYDLNDNVIKSVLIRAELASGHKGLFVVGSPDGSPFDPSVHGYFELTSTADISVTALRGSPPGAEPAYLWENAVNALEPRQIAPIPLSQVLYWAYQIQEVNLNDSVNDLAESAYDMLVIEPMRTDWSEPEAGDPWARDFDTAAAVAQLKNTFAHDGTHRKTVIAYIDIGQVEDWRWYWTWDQRLPPDEDAIALCNQSFPPPGWPDYIVKCDPDNWLHNYPVAYWDPDWQNIVIQGEGLTSQPFGNYVSIIDEVIRDGFDGIYLDWVEAFEDEDIMSLAADQGIDAAEAMVDFIASMRAYAKARNPHFLIIQQNAAGLISAAQNPTDHIDAIAQEGVWFDGDATDNWDDPNGYDFENDSDLTDYYTEKLDLYQQANLPVFVCEYALNSAPAAYQRAHARGYIPYVTRRSLGRLTTTPPPGLSKKP